MTSTRADPAGDRSLSEREFEVLRGMAAGHSNGEIARSVYLSEDTIKTHARRLFAKLGARDRAHAVFIGCRDGLLDLTPPPANDKVLPPPGTPTVTLAHTDHDATILARAFYGHAWTRPGALDRSRDALRRLVGA